MSSYLPSLILSHLTFHLMSFNKMDFCLLSYFFISLVNLILSRLCSGHKTFFFFSLFVLSQIFHKLFYYLLLKSLNCFPYLDVSVVDPFGVCSSWILLNEVLCNISLNTFDFFYIYIYITFVPPFTV